MWDIYAQIKKYQISKKYQKWITIHQIRDFYGAVMNIEFSKKNTINKNEINEMIYVTTWRFEQAAKKFCSKVWIDCWDYNYVISNIIKKWYDLKWFENNFSEDYKKHRRNYQLPLLGSKINKNDFLDEDLEFIYKEISYKIHNIKRQRWEKYISKNQLYCKSLAKKRILSLEEYHNAYSSLTEEEKKVIDNHGDIFTKVLKKIQEHTF